jgi:hypothetical protein
MGRKPKSGLCLQRGKAARNGWKADITLTGVLLILPTDKRLTVITKRPLGLILAVYLLAYLAASWLDLASTSLGLQRPGVTEKNVFATTGTGAYDARQAWLLTVAGGGVMLACMWFAAARATHVGERWLQHPVRSFGEFHINPFSRKAMEVTPLHFLSLALAFPSLRVIAAANNLLVYFYGWGPLGAVMQWIAERTTPLAGFAAVALSSFVMLMLVISPFAARLIYSWRAAERRRSHLNSSASGEDQVDES